MAITLVPRDFVISPMLEQGMASGFNALGQGIANSIGPDAEKKRREHRKAHIEGAIAGNPEDVNWAKANGVTVYYNPNSVKNGASPEYQEVHPGIRPEDFEKNILNKIAPDWKRFNWDLGPQQVNVPYQPQQTVPPDTRQDFLAQFLPFMQQPPQQGFELQKQLGIYDKGGTAKDDHMLAILQKGETVLPKNVHQVPGADDMIKYLLGSAKKLPVYDEGTLSTQPRDYANAGAQPPAANAYTLSMTPDQQKMARWNAQIAAMDDRTRAQYYDFVSQVGNVAPGGNAGTGILAPEKYALNENNSPEAFSNWMAAKKAQHPGELSNNWGVQPEDIVNTRAMQKQMGGGRISEETRRNFRPTTLNQTPAKKETTQSPPSTTEKPKTTPPTTKTETSGGTNTGYTPPVTTTAAPEYPRRNYISDLAGGGAIDYDKASLSDIIAHDAVWGSPVSVVGGQSAREQTQEKIAKAITLKTGIEQEKAQKIANDLNGDPEVMAAKKNLIKFQADALTARASMHTDPLAQAKLQYMAAQTLQIYDGMDQQLVKNLMASKADPVQIAKATIPMLLRRNPMIGMLVKQGAKGPDYSEVRKALGNTTKPGDWWASESLKGLSNVSDMDLEQMINASYLEQRKMAAFSSLQAPNAANTTEQSVDIGQYMNDIAGQQ